MDCSHPIHVGGMCANCGAILSDAQVADAISMMHDTETVTVSRQEARRLDSESTRRLLDNRKLALIVDLDQTIIHATVDPTVGEWLRDPSNPNYHALKGVGAFRLGLDGKAILEDGTAGSKASKAKKSKEDANGSQQPDTQDGEENPPAAPETEDEGCWYYVKPRPGLADFLKSLAGRYELHVYTMGTRSYADCVCKLVDPDGSLFGTRILSRDENGSLVQKSLSRLFPMDTSMVVIIDDRGDVWGWSPNLVKVIPYDFFVGSGDINATFLPALPAQAATPTSASDTPESATSSPDGAAASTSSPPASSPGADSSSSEPSETPPSSSPPNSGTSSDSQKSMTEELNDAAERETEQAADKAAKAQAEQSQKSAVSEQLDARPLAKMQEQLDEKLGVGTGTSTESSATSTPDLQNDKTDQESKQKPPPSTTPNASAPSSGASLASTTNATDPGPVSPPSAQPRAVLRDEDTELQRVRNILDEIHSQWYQEWDAGEPARAEGKGKDWQGSFIKPEVKDIIAKLKKEVLKTCDVVFSSLVPLGGNLQMSDYFWLALEYGASCSDELRPETTHVIAAKPGTAKVNSAQKRPNVVVVWPNWLHDSVARWAKQPEAPYIMPRAPPNAEEASSALPTDDELSLSDDGEWEEGEYDGTGMNGDDGEEDSWRSASSGGGLAGMDWAEADKELEEYLNASDGEDEGEDDESDSGSVAGYTSDGSMSRAPSRRGKRSRKSTPSTHGDATVPRTPSKLRNSTTSNDAEAGASMRGSESYKRRRVKGENEDTVSTPRKPGRVPKSNASTASNGTSVGGDDTMLRDLEDELEAALGGSDNDDADGDESTVENGQLPKGVEADK